MSKFQEWNLPAALMKALEKMNFVNPTPIQEQAIPLAMQGKDILGSAQTGTGKTGAFGIPLVAKLLSAPRGSAIILLPTRELAVQVMANINQMLAFAPAIKSALLIGGESMGKQFQQLKARPRVIVGTPGRINDHLERGSLLLHDANFLVLDETDRMLDMGFGVQIDRIVKFLPVQRQTLMFSATLPPAIIKVSEKYLKSPERIAVGQTNATAANVKQEIIHTSQEDKYNQLVAQLNQRTGSVIIFVKTKRGADRLADKLSRAKHSADAIHGDLDQRKRDRVIMAFRNKQHRILVATDIAARGLDIPHIEHVINYDLPQCPEDYIHRIGRTARNGSEGSAICLIAPDDNAKWRAIHKLLNPGEKVAPFPGGERREGEGPRGKRRPFRRFRGKGNGGQGGGGNGGGGQGGGNRRFGGGGGGNRAAA